MDCSAEVLSAFECPVCLEYMLPPYLQCQSGHLVCGNCRPKLQLEKIANMVKFPCKFSNSGCGSIFHHYDKVDHEETCEFRSYSCPCPGASCRWQGALQEVMPHLMKIREDIVFLTTDINLPDGVDWVMMQSCFGYHFMLVLGKRETLCTDLNCQLSVVALYGKPR
ncbi:unnamed protein product, partial [Mesorhabditis belari]|uniref:RING-type E3 ubiquitin transferase n=1 Tax=Mesorhabditis belari TaxID=2138241 RepID=A0AAF3JBA6_9BILA